MEPLKTNLHPKNRHRGLYDFQNLKKACPDLEKFITVNKYGNESIDFGNPLAVKALNQSILKFFYDLTWDIPQDFLCPPIPSRADYIHYVADLLQTPRNEKTWILDIGVGANCIYPLIGHREYGWNFIGTDIDPLAVSVANDIVKKNGLTEVIEIRLQKSRFHIFDGVIKNDDPIIDVSMCNPPFHSSCKEAQAGTNRKWKNLNIKTRQLNFGGKANELWCPGGEEAFITQMIKESIHVRCRWFTTLVSKASSLPAIYAELEQVKAKMVKTIEMSQGNKKSRIVAWTFMDSFSRPQT